MDLPPLLADEEGEYRDRLDIDEVPGGKTERVRASDGIHLGVAGAHRVEAHVRAIIHQVLSGDQPTQPTQPTVAGAEPLPSAPAEPSDGA